MDKSAASLKKLPDAPGVYLFVGARREVLYVGKATSLKDRVRSYFASDLREARGTHIVRMVERARRVDTRMTDSVLEALILEAKLIKDLKPQYNTRDKDDKSWNYLVITTNEAFPRLLTVRGKELYGDSGPRRGDGGKDAEMDDVGVPAFHRLLPPPRAPHVTDHAPRLTPSRTHRSLPIYGPFVHGGQFKEALKIIRKIFPYYDCARPVDVLREKNDRKLRFNETIGVYPPSGTTRAEYLRTIRQVRLFFEGRKRELQRTLEREMRTAAIDERFEDAAEAKRRLFALRHIEDVSLLRRDRDREREAPAIRIEAYDVAHLGGSAMVGVMVVVEGGEATKGEYRTFTIRSVSKSNDTAALKEVLERRLGHPEWRYPRLIVVDGGKAQQNAARAVCESAGVEIPIVAVVKDERHRPKTLLGPMRERRAYAEDILLANAEAHRFALARHVRARSASFRAKGRSAGESA